MGRERRRGTDRGKEREGSYREISFDRIHSNGRWTRTTLPRQPLRGRIHKRRLAIEFVIKPERQLLLKGEEEAEEEEEDDRK